MIDIHALAAATVPTRIGFDNYDEFESFRDFQDVLVAGRGQATDEQKRRVLYQILDLCGLFNAISAAELPAGMAFRAGKLEAAVDLANAILAEPRPLLTQEVTR